MLPQLLYNQLNEVPFVPFKVILSSGRDIEVLHPTFCIIILDGAAAIIYHDSYKISTVDTASITAIERVHIAQGTRPWAEPYRPSTN